MIRYKDVHSRSSMVYVSYISRSLRLSNSCFSHVVNLACKAVVEAFTQMKFSVVNADEYSPPKEPRPTFFIEALECNPIAIICSLICSINLFLFLKVKALTDLYNFWGLEHYHPVNLKFTRNIQSWPLHIFLQWVSYTMKAVGFQKF